MPRTSRSWRSDHTRSERDAPHPIPGPRGGRGLRAIATGIRRRSEGVDAQVLEHKLERATAAAASRRPKTGRAAAATRESGDGFWRTFPALDAERTLPADSPPAPDRGGSSTGAAPPLNGEPKMRGTVTELRALRSRTGRTAVARQTADAPRPGRAQWVLDRSPNDVEQGLEPPATRWSSQAPGLQQDGRGDAPDLRRDLPRGERRPMRPDGWADTKPEGHAGARSTTRSHAATSRS